MPNLLFLNSLVFYVTFCNRRLPLFMYRSLKIVAELVTFSRSDLTTIRSVWWKFATLFRTFIKCYVLLSNRTRKFRNWSGFAGPFGQVYVRVGDPVDTFFLPNWWFLGKVGSEGSFGQLFVMIEVPFQIFNEKRKKWWSFGKLYITIWNPSAIFVGKFGVNLECYL